MDAPLDPETLLRHGRFVSGLARALLRDPEAAEDVAQEAWAQWFRSGGRGENPRGWLGRAVRHLASNRRRSARRRAEHEAHAPAAEPAPDPGEAVAQAELLHRLVDAVYSLEEPYRATILARYFHGASARELAERQGEPVATVRSREQRALARLRERLDHTHGGCGAWATLLARWASVAEPAGLGAALVGSAAALVFVAGGAFLWRALGDRRATEEAWREAPLAALTEVSESGGEPALVSAKVREATREAVVSEGAAAPLADPDEGVLSGKTLDPSGASIASVSVSVRADGEAYTVVSDEHGEFRLEGLRLFESLTAQRSGYRTLFITDPVEGLHSPWLPVVVTLAPTGTFVLNLHDSRGAALAEVDVELRPRPEELQDAVLGRDLLRQTQVLEGKTDAGGRVEFPDVWAGLKLVCSLDFFAVSNQSDSLEAERLDADRLVLDSSEGGAPLVVPSNGIELEARIPELRLGGALRLPDGSPPRDGWMQLVDLGRPASDRGRILASENCKGGQFEFALHPAFVRGPLQLFARVREEPIDSVREGGATVSLAPALEASMELDERDGWLREGLELRLAAQSSGWITGRVFDSDGRLLKGCKLQILRPAFDPSNAPGPSVFCVDNLFCIDNLPPGDCDLAVMARPGDASRVQVFRSIPVGAREVELRFSSESPLRVRLQLVGGPPEALSILTLARFPLPGGASAPPAALYTRVDSLAGWPSGVPWSGLSWTNDTDDSGWSGAIVQAAAGGAPSIELAPGAAGDYAFGLLPRAGARRPYFPQCSPVLHFEAGEYTLEFALVPTTTIAGHLVADGTREFLAVSLVDALGRALPLEAGNTKSPVQVLPLAANGRFLLRDVPQGSSSLRVGTEEELRHGRFRREFPLELHAGANEPIELE